jgi:hypothetical protein
MLVALGSQPPLGRMRDFDVMQTAVGTILKSFAV